MRKAFIFVVVGVGLLLGLVWWFDIEEAGNSFTDIANDPLGALQGTFGKVSAIFGTTAVTAPLLGIQSASDISGYAETAGWTDSDLQVAVAIALAESGGDPNAVGDLNITPGGSIGLWQINLQAHPEYDAQSLTDPQTNANAAYAIYQAAGNTFSPWSTYTGGQYAKYITQAQAGVNA
jgi:Lysozyme like domain